MSVSRPAYLPARESSPQDTRIAFQNALNEPNDDSIVYKGKTYAVWSQAKIDLARLFHLIINRKVVEDTSKGLDPEPGEVLGALIEASNGNVAVAQQIAKLLKQVWGPELQGVILPKKDIEKGSVNRALNRLSHTHEVEIENGKFKVVHEAFFKSQILKKGFLSEDEVEAKKLTSYIKVKIIISGNIADLEKGDASKFTIKALNSAEKSDKEVAIKEDYAGFILLSFFPIF